MPEGLCRLCFSLELDLHLRVRGSTLDRTRALDLIERDSRPRFASSQCYLQTNGLQRTVSEVSEIIERAPKLPARARAAVNR